MAITLLVTVLLWVLGGVLGINSVSAALVGLGILLVTGVVTWKQCLAEGKGHMPEKATNRGHRISKLPYSY